MNDQDIEQVIQAKGLTAPRVTPADIKALMDRIVYTFDVRPNGSTTTLAHAFLDGDFYLATGVSACVSVENFDAELGGDIAIAGAKAAAEDKLWELEGYALRKRLAVGEQAAVTENLLSRAMGWIEILEQMLDAEPDSVVLEARNSKTGEEAEFKLSDFKDEVAAATGVVAKVEEVGDEEGAR